MENGKGKILFIPGSGQLLSGFSEKPIADCLKYGIWLEADPSIGLGAGISFSLVRLHFLVKRTSEFQRRKIRLCLEKFAEGLRMFKAKFIGNFVYGQFGGR